MNKTVSLKPEIEAIRNNPEIREAADGFLNDEENYTREDLALLLSAVAVKVRDKMYPEKSAGEKATEKAAEDWRKAVTAFARRRHTSGRCYTDMIKKLFSQCKGAKK